MSRQFATTLVKDAVGQFHRSRLGPLESWATAPALTRLFTNSDKKPTILIQHGAGGHGLLYSNLVRRFSPYALAVSLPHHELDDLLAAHPPDEGGLINNIPEMAALLEEALEHIPRPRILLGHSMGGAIAQTVVLNNKVPIDGLILYSTSTKLKVSPGIFDLLRNPTGPVSSDDFRYLFGPNVSIETLDYNFEMRFLHNQQAIADFTACNAFDVSSKISNVKVPTLIISGEKDGLTPVKFQELMHKNIANSKLVILPETGHMAHLEAEDAFCAEVEKFAASIASQPTPKL